MATTKGKRPTITPDPQAAERRERIRDLIELLRLTLPADKVGPILDRETTAWALKRQPATLDEWSTKWARGHGYGPPPVRGDDGRAVGYTLIDVARWIYEHTDRADTREGRALFALANVEPEIVPWQHARQVLALLWGAAEILELDLPEAPVEPSRD